MRTALEVGYRHLDTATMYRNEAEVGRAMVDSGVDRGEVFVTTKYNPRSGGDERDILEQRRHVAAERTGRVPAALESTVRDYNAAVRPGTFHGQKLDDCRTEGLTPLVERLTKRIAGCILAVLGPEERQQLVPPMEPARAGGGGGFGVVTAIELSLVLASWLSMSAILSPPLASQTNVSTLGRSGSLIEWLQ